MGVLRLAGFTGMWPIRDPRALPDNAPVFAENIRADGGAYLRPVDGYTGHIAVGTTTRKVHRLTSASTFNGSYWAQFADEYTDLLRSPIVNDAFNRIYIASPTTGAMHRDLATLQTGGVFLKLGVVPPTTAPTLAAVVNSGSIDELGNYKAPVVTKSYTVTFVNIWGEESAPGPTVEIATNSDRHIQLTAIPQPVAAADRLSIQYIRIYRTVSGESGGTYFYKVADVAPGVTTMTDSLSDTIVTGLGPLKSTTWALPPADMKGMVSMPNGIFVGWSGRNLYFSENFRPHAWPAEYKLTVDSNIVGLAVFGNTCVVCTEGNPAMVTGVKAAGMTLTKTDAPLPCLSRASIVPLPDGVLYSSNDGIVMVGPGGINLLTEELIPRDEWRDKFVPSSHKSAFYNGNLLVSFADPEGLSRFFSFQPANPSKVGMTYLDAAWFGTVHSVGVEPYTGRPFILANHTDGTNYIWEWEAGPSAFRNPHTYTWRSKEFEYPRPTNFNVYQAYFDDSVGGSLALKVYVTLRGNDGSASRVLVYNQNIPASGREIRMPSGYKGDIWQFEFTGTKELQSFMIATSVSELRSG